MVFGKIKKILTNPALKEQESDSRQEHAAEELKQANSDAEAKQPSPTLTENETMPTEPIDTQEQIAVGETTVPCEKCEECEQQHDLAKEDSERVDTMPVFDFAKADDPSPKIQSKTSRADIRTAMQANNDGIQAKNDANWQLALSKYNESLQLYPEYAIAYYNRGILHMEQNELSSAIADYTRAIEINPRDPEFYNNLANVYVKKQDFATALANYDRAISLFPNYSEAYHNRALALVRMEKLAEAENDFQRAIVLNPDLLADHYNLACLFARKGEIDNALKALEKALRKGYANWEHIHNDPDLEEIRKHPTFEDLMDAWQKTGQ